MKALKFLNDYIEEGLLTFFMVVIVISMGVQVVTRYLFDNPQAWCEELSRYCAVWSVFIGLSYTIKRECILKVDFLTIRFSKSVNKALLLIIYAGILILCCYLMTGAVEVVQRAVRLNSKSSALQIPFSFVYFSVVLGLSMTMVRSLQKIVKTFKAGKRAAVKDF